MNKDKLIKELGEKKALTNNTIDLNAYENGLRDMYDKLIESCTSPDVIAIDTDKAIECDITLICDKEVKSKLPYKFVHEIGKLMLSEIKMNREVHKELTEWWVVGCCKISNMDSYWGASGRRLEFMYGSLKDEDWIKLYGDIFVKLPL